MTCRTKIQQTDSHEVKLTYLDPDTDECVERVFWVPTGGGYVREGARHTPDDPQVCRGLERLGPALETGPGDLLAVIRENWRQARRRA